MEFRQLNTFIQVAKFQSFSKAAEHLGYSQSAVTVQIRMLEKELNTRLFDRMGKKILLTSQGQEFLECANTILYDVEKAKCSMESETAELRSSLRIGTIESLCFSKFPSIIHYFREHYPKVELRIVTASPEELISQMEQNELDLIYILDTPRWTKDWIKVMEIPEDMIFVCSSHAAFVSDKEFSIAELLDKPFFLTEKDANYRQAFDQALARKCLDLHPHLEISNTEFIIHMLEQNDGISLLPYFAVQKEVEDDRLAILHVNDIQITMYRQLLYHKSKFLTEEMKKFIYLAELDYT